MSTTPEGKRNGLSQTPSRSSASVKVFWLDRPKTLSRIREAVKDLINRHPEIEQAVLFGSLARGDAAPGSDADLLLILRESDLPFLARSARYFLTEAGIGVDIFAYTRSELDAMLAGGNTFVAQALREGIVLEG